MDILKSRLEIKCLYAISILMVMSATVSFSTTNLGGPLRNIIRFWRSVWLKSSSARKMALLVASSILIATFGIISITSQAFKCIEAEFKLNGNKVSPSSLTFGQIRESCSNVDTAARLYGCTIDDLV